MKRTIFIGDVHGCYNELITLLDSIQPASTDRIILLGDLINRGPSPEKVLHFVFEQGFECLKGNHEADYSRYFEKPWLPLPEAYAQLKANLPEEVHTWLMGLPVYLDEPEFLAVHAGIHPFKPVPETEHNILLAVRYCDHLGEKLNQPAFPPWYNYYTGTKKIIYGHWAAQGLNIRSNTIGLDSGCVYGKKLSAYILETNKIVQVQASSAYVPII